MYHVDAITVLPLTDNFTSFYYLPHEAADYVIVAALYDNTVVEIYRNSCK